MTDRPIKPPNWFVEPIQQLMSNIRTNTTHRPDLVVEVSADVGLVLGMPPNTSLYVNTAGGRVRIWARKVNE